MKIYEGKFRQRYELDRQLGSGGEGTVFSIKGDPSRVVKIYKEPKKEHVEKISKMISSELRNKPDVAFPEDIVFENGVFKGYVMKIARGSSFNSSYANSSDNKVTQEIRIQLAINLTIALKNVHENGFVFGDFNPANIKYDPKSRTVTLIDTDSFVFDKYGGFVARPEMVPKEIKDGMKDNEKRQVKKNLPFSVESDTYSLAVHVFRLLMNGEHPFVYKATHELNKQPMYSYDFDKSIFPYIKNELDIVPPPHAIPLESLPLDLQTIFVRMFKDGYSDKTMRPSVDEILEELKVYYENIKRCLSNKSHVYYNDLKICPYCQADERYKLIFQGKVPSPVKVSTIEYVYNVQYEDIIKKPEKIKQLENGIKANKSHSMMIMGRLYSDGVAGCVQNNKKAFDYFYSASTNARPDSEAEYRLALCYLDGIGTKPNKNEAVKWLTASSNMHFEPATSMLQYVSQINNLVEFVTPSSRSISKNNTLFGKSKEEKQLQQQTSKSTGDSSIIETKSSSVTNSSVILKDIYKKCIQGTMGWSDVSQYLPELKKQAGADGESAYYFAEILSTVNPRSTTCIQYYKMSAKKDYIPALLKLAEIEPKKKGDYYEKIRCIDPKMILPNDKVTSSNTSTNSSLSKSNNNPEFSSQITVKSSQGVLMSAGTQHNLNDYPKVIQQYVKDADSGDAEAAHMVAIHYRDGRSGVLADKGKYTAWMLRYAELKYGANNDLPLKIAEEYDRIKKDEDARYWYDLSSSNRGAMSNSSPLNSNNGENSKGSNPMGSTHGTNGDQSSKGDASIHAPNSEKSDDVAKSSRRITKLLAKLLKRNK